MRERLFFMDGNRRKNTVRLLRPGEGAGRRRSPKKFGRTGGIMDGRGRARMVSTISKCVPLLP